MCYYLVKHNNAFDGAKNKKIIKIQQWKISKLNKYDLEFLCYNDWRSKIDKNSESSDYCLGWIIQGELIHL